jgi:hypothetical protein
MAIRDKKKKYDGKDADIKVALWDGKWDITNPE